MREERAVHLTFADSSSPLLMWDSIVVFPLTLERVKKHTDKRINPLFLHYG